MATLDRGVLGNLVADAIDERMEIIAQYIAAEARQRCPVRKSEDRGRRTIVALTKDSTYMIGRQPISTSEMVLAAKRIGINLKKVQKKRYALQARRIARGQRPLPRNGDLGIVVRRPRVYAEDIDATPRYGKRALSASQWATMTGKTQSAYQKRVNAITEQEEKPGALRRSIHVMNESDGKIIRYAIRATGSEERSYARYVEFPTVHTAAQPFLLPALKNNERRIAQRLRGAIGKR